MEKDAGQAFGYKLSFSQSEGPGCSVLESLPNIFPKYTVSVIQDIKAGKTRTHANLCPGMKQWIYTGSSKGAQVGRIPGNSCDDLYFWRY